MKIVLAPDSYKECLPAQDVAAAMASAVRASCPDAEVVELPLADGGEGTATILTHALGGKTICTPVSGPLGSPVRASCGIAGKTAVIEVAAACGLSLVPAERRNPMIASSRGVGELMMDAVRHGCESILIGLGGSATCDGGAGMMSVPGLREALSGVKVTALCDVDAPFTGQRGAARCFAPQKGASPADVEVLEKRLEALADRMLSETGCDVRKVPGAGAAGGLGGALAAYFGARLVPGVEEVMDRVVFDAAVADASLIITGEGCSDIQTLAGKVPFGVVRRAAGVPVALVSGRIRDRGELVRAGFCRLVQITPADMPLPQALQPAVAASNIRRAIASLMESGPGKASFAGDPSRYGQGSPG